jgi:hypothetical protein
LVLVAVLAAGAAAGVPLDATFAAEITCPWSEDFGQHSDRYRGSVDPAAFLCRRHALNAMAAGLVIERFDALPCNL